MTSIQQQHPGDMKIQVTVQPGTANLHEQTDPKTGEKIYNQILASLAETKKHLPQQVNTFLDSMEGKTLDDLRSEAMHLANKAQEEAKKKTLDMSTYGKNQVESAKQRVQDLTDLATNKTNDMKQKGLDLGNDIKQKGLDLGKGIVQPPLQKTKDVTTTLANRTLDTTANLTVYGVRLAHRTLFPIVTPIARTAQYSLTPLAIQAKGYLPQNARAIIEQIEQSVKGKSFDELSQLVLLNTRKNLLSAKKIEAQPTLQDVLVELKDATTSGDLFRNALSLSEQAADKVFGGETQVSSDAHPIKRVYNLSNKTIFGLKDLALQSLGLARQSAMDAAQQRVDSAKGSVASRADAAKQQAVPLLQKVGSLPVVPGFVYKALRSEPAPVQEHLETESAQVAAAPVNIKVEVKASAVGGVAGEGKVTTTTTTPAESKTTVTKNAPASADAKVKVSEHEETSLPPTEDASPTGKKGKKHSKA